MILPNSSQMRAIDQCAINHFGIPGIVLMENAGLGTVLKIEMLYGPLQGAHVPIFIGPGNNGGDGLVIARHLLQRKARPVLVYLIEPSKLSGDSATNLSIIAKLNLPAVVCSNANHIPEMRSFLLDSESRFGPPKVFVDAIFGTGLCRSIKGHFREIIQEINTQSKAHNVPIVAVDTPSGLDSDTGSVFGICINAQTTATYGYAKIGQMMAKSSLYTGELHVIDIGIPPAVSEHVQVSISAIYSSCCRRYLKQLERSPDSHKGSYGHLLVVAGSAGKAGAAILAGRGALRSGCGLISLCCPNDLNSEYKIPLTEAMTIPLGSETVFNRDDFEPLLTHAEGKNGLVLGPGIGQDPSTADLVVDLYNTIDLPMVVDADALNIIASHREKLLPPPGARILTPHPGEMARLINRSTSIIQANRIKAVEECAEMFNTVDSEIIVVLKGAATLVASGGHIMVNTTGNPAMAAGGMGDILSGMIGSLVCQGLSPYDAAVFAVFLHGYCGDLLYNSRGIGFSASELADEIGGALVALRQDGR